MGRKKDTRVPRIKKDRVYLEGVKEEREDSWRKAQSRGPLRGRFSGH